MFELKQILILASAYLVGAIPTGYWFANFFFGIDITQNGSGNIGATNIARVLGKRYFLLIFLIDAGKAYATLFFVQKIVSPTDAYMIFACAGALLLGNAYSPFLCFRGGKGVATSLGIFAFVLPPVFLIAFISLWLVILMVFKEVFIASLSASFCIMLGYGLWFGHTTMLYFLFGLWLWLLLRHQKNILAFFAANK